MALLEKPYKPDAQPDLLQTQTTLAVAGIPSAAQPQVSLNRLPTTPQTAEEKTLFYHGQSNAPQANSQTGAVHLRPPCDVAGSVPLERPQPEYNQHSLRAWALKAVDVLENSYNALCRMVKAPYILVKRVGSALCRTLRQNARNRQGAREEKNINAEKTRILAEQTRVLAAQAQLEQELLRVEQRRLEQDRRVAEEKEWQSQKQHRYEQETRESDGLSQLETAEAHNLCEMVQSEESGTQAVTAPQDKGEQIPAQTEEQRQAQRASAQQERFAAAKARVIKGPQAQQMMPLRENVRLEKDIKPEYNMQEEEHTYTKGDWFSVFGKLYPLRVEMNDTTPDADGVTFSDTEIILRVKRGTGLLARKTLMENWYRSILVQRLKVIANPLYKKMDCKEKVRIRLMSNNKKWFSNNNLEKTIWVNANLAKLSPTLLDYAVLSELCILQLRKIGVSDRELPDAYEAKMEEVLPGWRTLGETLDAPFVLHARPPQRPQLPQEPLSNEETQSCQSPVTSA